MSHIHTNTDATDLESASATAETLVERPATPVERPTEEYQQHPDTTSGAPIYNHKPKRVRCSCSCHGNCCLFAFVGTFCFLVVGGIVSLIVYMIVNRHHLKFERYWVHVRDICLFLCGANIAV